VHRHLDAKHLFLIRVLSDPPCNLYFNITSNTFPDYRETLSHPARTSRYLRYILEIRIDKQALRFSEVDAVPARMIRHALVRGWCIKMRRANDKTAGLSSMRIYERSRADESPESSGRPGTVRYRRRERCKRNHKSSGR